MAAGESVYVVEAGDHPAFVAGVYRTAQAAMAAFPDGQWAESAENSGVWYNDLPDDVFCSITRHELE